MTDDQIGSVVIQNCSLALAIADGCAGSVGEIYEESFVRFDQRVAVYVQFEQIGLLPCRNCLALEAAPNVIIGGDQGRAILRGDVEGNAAGWSRERRSDSKPEPSRASIAFISCHIVDAQYGNIIVENCPDSLAIDDDCARHIRHVYQERFVWLDLRVAIDGDIEVISLLFSRNRLGCQTARHVIVVGNRGRIVLGGDVESHRGRSRRG